MVSHEELQKVTISLYKGGLEPEEKKAQRIDRRKKRDIKSNSGYYG